MPKCKDHGPQPTALYSYCFKAIAGDVSVNLGNITSHLANENGRPRLPILIFMIIVILTHQTRYAPKLARDSDHLANSNRHATLIEETIANSVFAPFNIGDNCGNQPSDISCSAITTFMPTRLQELHFNSLSNVGMISPSKLRMKLMGGQRKKDGGSKSNSARTSPAKLQVEDTDQFVNNSLLASTNSGVSDEEVSSMGISSVTFDSTQVDQSLVNPKDHSKDTRVKSHQLQKPDSSNSSSVHPLRSLEDENLDYDSNASSSSFEFHKGERSTHNPISRSLLRPMSSKWNDAEKWIINKQIIQHHNQKNSVQNRANRSSVKRVDFCQPALQTGTERFSFTPSQPQQDTVSGQTPDGNESTNPCPESKDLLEIDT
nr:hypothetical protein [Tanacetum cinerariifolium]